MKATLTKEEYEAIYHLWDEVSPITGDCGLLCGAACCTGGGEDGASDGKCENEAAVAADDGEELGIYLLPGEEQLFTKKEKWLAWHKDRAGDYDFPESWRGSVWFVRCVDPPRCPRELRPIQCRTFPLLPHLDPSDELSLVYNDVDLPYTCPLIRDRTPLNGDFYEATLEAWRRLIKDPLIYDLVKMDSRERQGY